MLLKIIRIRQQKENKELLQVMSKMSTMLKKDGEVVEVGREGWLEE